MSDKLEFSAQKEVAAATSFFLYCDDKLIVAIFGQRNYATLHQN